MTLVDRFIEVQGWTTSRKVALLGAFVAGVTGVNLVVGHVLMSPLGWVDMRFYDTLAALFTAHGLLTALVAWRVGRSGAEGGWTYYLLILPFNALMFTTVWAFGYLSTAWIVGIPLTMIILLVMFHDRASRITAVLTTVLIAVLVVVTTLDWLPYAPALEERDLDHQTSAGYAFATGWALVYIIATLTLFIWLVATASRLTTARLDEAHRRLGEASRVIARYVPAEVAQDILEGRLSDADAHQRRKLTVFFSDLVGFSDIAEELEPEDLAVVLNEYFGEMTAIAHRHHGTVDELQGDALLILFGAPHATTDREHALNAVCMAAEMHAALPGLNARWRDAGITETLAVRMGINTGVVTVGNFGTADRMKYAALGKHVNIAARLQAIAEPGTTVVSYSTYLLVKDEVDCTALGPQQLKGITKPVEAFAL